MNFCCGNKIIDISISVAPTYIGTHVMHICVCLMIDMFSTSFIHKPFSQETFSKFVCALFFYCYFVVFRNVVLAASSNSWASLLLISFIQPSCLWSVSKIFSVSRSFQRFWLLFSPEFQLVSNHKWCSIQKIMVNSEFEP